MKQVDKLVAHLVRFAADAVIATSGAPVVVRSTGGDKTSNQVLDHAAIVTLVREVLPPACEAELRSGATVRFVYAGSPSGVATLEVTPGATAWRVKILPGATAGLPRTPTDEAPEPSGIDRLLRLMTRRGASDLHLAVGCPPLVRLHGEILALESVSPLTDPTLRAMLMEITPARNREEFERRRDTDFAHEIPGVARFRVNLFTDRNGIGSVMRRIPFEILSAEKLGLRRRGARALRPHQGPRAGDGPDGVGQEHHARGAHRPGQRHPRRPHRHHRRPDRVRAQRQALPHQPARGAGAHRRLPHALRAALREDPDVVLVGEMRDLETIEIAIETAETGTWSSARCTPTPRRAPSTASSTSSPPTVRRRSARCSRSRSRGSSRRRSARRSAAGAWPPTRCSSGRPRWRTSSARARPSSSTADAVEQATSAWSPWATRSSTWCSRASSTRARRT
jgi:twitching motility protein PilT